MPKAFGKATLAYEKRTALRFIGPPRPELSADAAAAEHQAMLDRLMALAAQLNGWPDGKPPSWPARKSASLHGLEIPKAQAA